MSTSSSTSHSYPHSGFSSYPSGFMGPTGGAGYAQLPGQGYSQSFADGSLYDQTQPPLQSSSAYSSLDGSLAPVDRHRIRLLTRQ